MAIVISGVNNNDKITASDGTIDLLSGVSYASTITAPSFNASGNITAASINIGNNIQIGNAGIVTATTFLGNLTGNVNATSNLLLQIGGSEKFRVGSSGQLGIGGANYGTSGQVLTSGGSGSAATWSTVNGTTINDNADNRIITGSGTANTLNAESDITYDGTQLVIASGKYVNSASPYRIASHPVLGYDSFTDISGGSYATRLGSTGSSTLRSTQIYGGGAHLATFDGVNSRLGLRTTTPAKDLHVYNPSVATVRIETGDSRGQAWDILSTNGAASNSGTLSFRDESGSAYLEFGANGGSPELTVRNGGANDLLHIDNDGNVNKPRNAFAIIYTNSGDAGVSNNKIKDAYAIFTGIHLNQGSHYSTSTGRFTCPVDGVYGVAFASNLNMSNMSTGQNFNIQTRKNGSIMLYNYDTVFTTGWQYMSFTNYVNCNANDWLAIYFGGSNVFGADQGSAQWGELYFWLVQ